MVALIMRGVVIVILTVISTVHYQSGEWLLLAGDAVVGIAIAIVWVLPFYLATRRQNKK